MIHAECFTWTTHAITFSSFVCRSLRISTPLSDSACSSSTESSDGESASNYPLEPYGGEPIEILPGLFLGNAAHSEDINKLQKYNIRYILNVSTLPNQFQDTGKIEYLQIAITDHWSQDLSVHFPSAIKFIEEAKAKNVSCLVHCLAGVSRVSWDEIYFQQLCKLNIFVDMRTVMFIHNLDSKSLWSLNWYSFSNKKTALKANNLC